LAGHAPHRPLNHVLALWFVVCFVFHRLKLMDCLSGLGRDFLMRGQFRLTSDACISRILRVGGYRRRDDGAYPVDFGNGLSAPLDVNAGNKVLFGKWSGTEVKIDGQDLLIMKESDILGVVA
jgi:hypothetical protein